MIKRKKILIFTDWYLPGFKAGGPIKSIKNLASQLQDELDLYIFTSDRDLGDKVAYDGFSVNIWTELENHKVFYASPEFSTKENIIKEFERINPDAVYINGVFSTTFSISPLLALRKKAKKLIIAPRGMFNKGALSLKSTKKKIFITLAKLLRWYKNVQWHVTSKEEKNALLKVINPKSKITVIKNLITSNSPRIKQSNTEEETLKLVFVGRLSKVKNLHFLIQVLNNVSTQKQIILDVIGSKEDESYWEHCKSLINSKSNYTLNYLGELSPNEVDEKLSQYDFFVSPTLNENFGHAIVEALQVGLPILISDQTPWVDLEKYACGYSLSLEMDLWVEALEKCANLSSAELVKMREATTLYINDKLDMEADKKSYLKLFS